MKTEIEIWKDIQGYEGKYKISNQGRLMSKKGITLGDNHKPGYRRIRLGSPHFRTVMVHRLILEAFNPTTNTSLEINHINGIKDDNRVTNLEWVTKSENVFHSYRVLGRKRPDHSKTMKRIILSKNGISKEFDGINHAGRELGISPSNICEAAKYGRKTKGYDVKYIPAPNESLELI